MTEEQRIQLKEMRGIHDPDFSMEQANARDIESLRTHLGDLISRVADVSSSLERIGTKISKELAHLAHWVSDLENATKSHVQAIHDRHSELEKRSSAIEESLQTHRKEHSQIIEEIRDDMKISFSKLGGGTMPRLMQAETPTGTIDGSNTVFTLRNIPLFMEQDGQHISAANGGFTVDGYIGSVTVTCSVAPTQSLNSYYQ